LDNLIAAYDGLGLLARESAKTHIVDRRAAESTEHGYGGTRLPEGMEADITVTSQAVKTIGLILDDCRRPLRAQQLTSRIRGRLPLTPTRRDAA
jgi:hypothetical protein